MVTLTLSPEAAKNLTIQILEANTPRAINLGIAAAKQRLKNDDVNTPNVERGNIIQYPLEDAETLGDVWPKLIKLIRHNQIDF